MPGCLLPWIWSPHLILYLMDLVPISSVLTLYWHDLDRMEHAETDTEAPSLQLVWIWFDLLENIIRAHSWVEQRCITPLVFIVTCLFVTSFGWCLMFNWPDNELFVWMAHVIRLWIVTSCMFPPAITKCHISWHDTMLHWCSYITPRHVTSPVLWLVTAHIPALSLAVSDTPNWLLLAPDNFNWEKPNTFLHLVDLVKVYW